MSGVSDTVEQMFERELEVVTVGVVPEGVPAEFREVSDHDLLLGGLSDEVAANVCAARRLARLEEFRCRRERDQHARHAADPHFALTPIQETVIEAGELWGLSEGRVRADLRNTRTLLEHFPEVWAMCLAGALDPYKASLVAETAKFALDRPIEFARFAQALTDWLRRGIPAPDGERPVLVNRTLKQLRNKIGYELKKLKPRDADERFRRAFADRAVRAQIDAEDGVGHLGIGGTVTDIQLADYRLTLIARALRAGGDTRTLEQLRADAALDLLTGRVAVDAGLTELEDAGNHTRDPANGADEGGDTGDSGVVRRLPTLDYARPVINVTVPIQTLMGLSDHPAVLSGGTVIPASLARMIAEDPDSAWYRMLTDAHGAMIELSTEAYRPTKPIWRAVVARDNTCFRSNCDKPATTGEVDHRVPWPRGATSTRNLGPGCKADHKGKHASGFGLVQNPDQSFTLTTAAGFAHTTYPVRHPIEPWPEEALFESQFSATEILDAIGYLRFERQAIDNSTFAHLDEDEQWLLDHAS